MTALFSTPERSHRRAAVLTGLLVLFLLLPTTVWAQVDSGTSLGTISARVAKEELGKTGAGIAAFFTVDGGPPPRPGQLRRVPDQSTEIEPNGSLQAIIPPGRYYIGIILGRPEHALGPPSPGERTFVAHDAAGEPKIFTVVAGQRTEAGLLNGKVPNEKSSPLPEFFTIEGTISDQAGRPAPKAVILVFKAKDNSLRPVYLHQVTSGNGHYSLRLAAGRSYNLMVRSSLGGGQPGPGEQIGRYDEEEMKDITAKAGEVLKKINIRLLTVPQPGESGKKHLKKPGMNLVPQSSPEKAP